MIVALFAFMAAGSIVGLATGFVALAMHEAYSGMMLKLRDPMLDRRLELAAWNRKSLTDGR